MNRAASSIATLVLGMALIGAAPSLGAAEIVLKAAHNGFEGHPFQDGHLKLKEVLEARTGGAVEVQIFPAEQLGTEEQVAELVNLGTVAFNVNGTASLSGFVPEAELLNLPFIFKDLDHFYRVLEGPVGNRIAQAVEDRLEVVVLGWLYSGNRNLWNSKHRVLSPADMAGLKIRTMSSQVMIDSFNALGGQATPISFGELYTALQQGVVDGAEGDHIDLLGEKFHETVKYVSPDRAHLPSQCAHHEQEGLRRASGGGAGRGLGGCRPVDPGGADGLHREGRRGPERAHGPGPRLRRRRHQRVPGRA